MVFKVDQAWRACSPQGLLSVASSFNKLLSLAYWFPEFVDTLHCWLSSLHDVTRTAHGSCAFSRERPLDVWSDAADCTFQWGLNWSCLLPIQKVPLRLPMLYVRGCYGDGLCEWACFDDRLIPFRWPEWSPGWPTHYSDSLSVHHLSDQFETIFRMGEPDMENRDPNNLNDHVKVSLWRRIYSSSFSKWLHWLIGIVSCQVCFEDVIGEPEGAHSHDCVWRLSYKCFEGGKKICYMILTFLCAAPLALCWGCQFACITFGHIWQVTPCLKVWQINVGCLQSFYTSCINCYYVPLCEAWALLFSKIGK